MLSGNVSHPRRRVRGRRSHRPRATQTSPFHHAASSQGPAPRRWGPGRMHRGGTRPAVRPPALSRPQTHGCPAPGGRAGHPPRALHPSPQPHLRGEMRRAVAVSAPSVPTGAAPAYPCGCGPPAGPSSAATRRRRVPTPSLPAESGRPKDGRARGAVGHRPPGWRSDGLYRAAAPRHPHPGVSGPVSPRRRGTPSRAGGVAEDAPRPRRCGFATVAGATTRDLPSATFIRITLTARCFGTIP